MCVISFSMPGLAFRGRPAAVVAHNASDRADEVGPCLDITDTLAGAPDADHSRLEGGFFKVPRVIG